MQKRFRAKYSIAITAKSQLVLSVKKIYLEIKQIYKIYLDKV